MKKSLKDWCIENNAYFILDMWDYEKNDISPENVSYGSEIKVNWKCPVCNYTWDRKINSTTSGKRGCPECTKKERIKKTNQSKIKKSGSLESNYPELLLEWDYDKNTIKPSELTPKSNVKVYWKCSKCNNHYPMSVGLKVNGCSCPNCKSLRRTETLIKKNGSLYDKMPELEKEWDIENNIVSIKEVTPNCNKKYSWICKNCGHHWLASPATRLKGHGCPSCSGRVATKDNNLLLVAPELAKEWHPTKNGNLKPEDVKPYSDIKVWWLCKNGHEWKASISNRFQGRGCQKCSAELKSSFPEQALLFYIKKIINVDNRIKINGWECDVFIPDLKLGIEYDGIVYHSSKKIIDREKRKNQAFKDANIDLIRIKESYDKSGIEGNNIYFIVDSKYKNLDNAINDLFKLLKERYNINSNITIDTISDRQKIIKEYYKIEKRNSFASVYPELVSMWNYEKNFPLKPENFKAQSNEKVWWKCEKNHEWEESIINVAKGNRCPFCSGHKVLAGFNDLETTNPLLAKDWNYDKNIDILPSQFSDGSNTSVWWKCHKCGHEWKKTIAYRKKQPLCPNCSTSIKRNKDSYIKHEQWNTKYLLAKDYFKENGNLNINSKYISKDGTKLGSWIRTQRVAYKNGELSDDRINRLNEIEMIWDIKRR